MTDETDDIRCQKCGIVSLGCNDADCPETTAGLLVGEVLPVVAWRRRYLKPTGPWNYASAISSTEPLLNRELGPQETEALTTQAPAQATINELRAEVARLEAKLKEQALQYLSDKPRRS